VSQDARIQQLLREGIEAARAGDRAKAREKFEEATELDENNEKAWFYLASVVESDEERRVCLSNVLVINPDNERAQQMMKKLDNKLREQLAAEEVIPGVSRRQLMLVAGGGGAFVLIIILIVVLVASGNARRDAEVAAALTSTIQVVTDIAVTAQAQNTAAAETQIALIGTDTPTPRSMELPPTFTPSPPPTATPAPQQLPLPGPEISGTIITWEGPDALSNGARELYRYILGGEITRLRIGDELGRDVRFTGTGDRLIYTRYFSATFDFGIEAININGTQPQIIRAATGVLGVEQPDQCRTANRVVFVGVPEGRPTGDNLSFDFEPPKQVFIVDLDLLAQAGTPANATIRLTNDSARYSYPTFSPDCSRIAVVKDDFNSAQPGADIVLIDVNNFGNVTKVTNDLDTYTEQTPRWTTDGSRIIFSAFPASNPQNSDIVLINADGSGAPQVLIRDDSDDILPVLSPDNAYLAFSSNRLGAYNVFIQRLADGQLFQLTSSRNPVFIGGWWR
jgi:hypothetical protein